MIQYIQPIMAIVNLMNNDVLTSSGLGEVEDDIGIITGLKSSVIQ